MYRCYSYERGCDADKKLSCRKQAAQLCLSLKPWDVAWRSLKVIEWYVYGFLFACYSNYTAVSLPFQNLPFQQILPTVDFFYLLDCLTITGLDRTYHAHHFVLVSHFNFLFIPCGRLSWLSVSFLLHVKYTQSYRIVSFQHNTRTWQTPS